MSEVNKKEILVAVLKETLEGIVEIPDCLKPLDSIKYLFREEENGPDNPPQKLP